MSKSFLSGILSGYFTTMMQRSELAERRRSEEAALAQRRNEMLITKGIEEARIAAQRAMATEAETGQTTRFREGLGEESRQFDRTDENRDREFDTSTALHREDRTSNETLTREEIAARQRALETEGAQNIREITTQAAANNAPSPRMDQAAQIDAAAEWRARVAERSASAQNRNRARIDAYQDRFNAQRTANEAATANQLGQTGSSSWGSNAPSSRVNPAGIRETISYTGGGGGGGQSGGGGGAPSIGGRSQADAAVDIEEMRAAERARIRRSNPMDLRARGVY